MVPPAFAVCQRDERGGGLFASDNGCYRPSYNSFDLFLQGQPVPRGATGVDFTG
ncbi:MAG TPA: hypothetical protein VKF38_06465 [Anaerolineaceae bacterium]|nr:hypothetical protein [Anaerolineaceae bacterium]